MSAYADAGEWAETVRGFAEKRGARWEPIGGLNPRGGPVALCPGGTNRVTGELAAGFWGAFCDADERTEGGGLFGGGSVVPRALLVKAHMPDLATVVPIFHVESIERTAEDLVDRRSRRRVEFESLAFNKRFIATVPAEHDPIALRELFSPAFLDWTTRIPGEVDFGITDRQLFFFWRLRELNADQLEDAVKAAGGLFTKLHREMDENNIATYDPGPWNAGLEPFPKSPA